MPLAFTFTLPETTTLPRLLTLPFAIYDWYDAA
jgi:hypothetical protein